MSIFLLRENEKVYSLWRSFNMKVELRVIQEEETFFGSVI